ncbi:MAG: alpha/beta fold hydrolase [Paracoccaceae bacterium]|nr:alpha/beta fold hydrolase [Paracoccaceae bacterium]
MPVLTLALAIWALLVLEGARSGVEITQSQVGPTPVTLYNDAADAPVVVMAHGFAGSRQMMQAYALTLARAGYRVHAFDFEGHGRHAVSMSGDVNSLDGTTRLLVEQTQEVIKAARRGDTPVALLGHSMATDILVRVAEDSEGIGPVVLLSPFSQAITASHPQNLVLIAGTWEAGLRAFSLRAARMVDPAAEEGQTVRAGDVTRRAAPAPFSEHVAILHSRVGKAEALRWLDAAYGRDTAPANVPPTGWALLALLAAITALAAPLSKLLGPKQPAPTPLTAKQLALLTIAPALVVPLIAAPLDTRLLPVLVADYLALHLALYGFLQLALLWRIRGRPPAVSPVATGLILLWGLGAFGVALDRYGANFWPVTPRLWIIAALSLGAVPFMLADAWANFGAPLWQRIALRVGLLTSLGIAVALDFEGLFFLLMIAPVIVLFYLTFGVMGRFAAQRAGPESAGLALGLILAWALGVSFPLFAA